MRCRLLGIKSTDPFPSAYSENEMSLPSSPFLPFREIKGLHFISTESKADKAPFEAALLRYFSLKGQDPPLDVLKHVCTRGKIFRKLRGS